MGVGIGDVDTVTSKGKGPRLVEQALGSFLSGLANLPYKFELLVGKGRRSEENKAEEKD
jgi:hypothetical protein